MVAVDFHFRINCFGRGGSAERGKVGGAELSGRLCGRGLPMNFMGKGEAWACPTVLPWLSPALGAKLSYWLLEAFPAQGPSSLVLLCTVSAISAVGLAASSSHLIWVLS